jgi:hypothetical protein
MRRSFSFSSFTYHWGLTSACLSTAARGCAKTVQDGIAGQRYTLTFGQYQSQTIPLGACEWVLFLAVAPIKSQ